MSLVSLNDFYRESVQITYRPAISDHPDENTLEGKSWWQEQVDRCLHGWIAPNGHYINGILYFYLNFCKVPLKKDECFGFQWESPYYRDNDEEVLSILWSNLPKSNGIGDVTSAKSHIEVKARGVAWTSYTTLGSAMYSFVFRTGFDIGFAAPNKDLIKIEKDWFEHAWNLLPAIFKAWDGKELIPKSSDYAFYVGTYNEKIFSPHSRVLFDCIESDSKCGVYKGRKMSDIYVIEAGLWVDNSLKNFISENEPSIKLGDKQWGAFIIEGASNVILNKASDYKDLFVSPDLFNATRHFTPKTKVLRGFIDYNTGKSRESEALSEIKKVRLSKQHDKEAYHQEIIENPLTWQEALLSPCN